MLAAGKLLFLKCPKTKGLLCFLKDIAIIGFALIPSLSKNQNKSSCFISYSAESYDKFSCFMQLSAESSDKLSCFMKPSAESSDKLSYFM